MSMAAISLSLTISYARQTMKKSAIEIDSSIFGGKKSAIEIDSSIFGGKKSAIEIDLSTRRCGGKDFGL
jgi:hypothetical protein